VSKERTLLGRGWRHLWCVPQASRERACGSDWNRLEMNAIGSTWGREHIRTSGVGAGLEHWSTTIVAELTR